MEDIQVTENWQAMVCTGQQLAIYSGNNLQVRDFCLINIICDDVMLKQTSMLSLTERFRIRFGSIFICL